MISARLDLKPHVDALRQYVPTPRGVKKIHHDLGSYNAVMFGYLPVHYEQQDQKQLKSSASTSVVYTVPKFFQDKVTQSSQQRAFSCLRNARSPLESKSVVSGIHSPFIQTFLYQGQHGKVSEKMLGDLYKVFTEGRYTEKPSFVDLKDIFAQILLAVHALHSHGLVHRDIKLENILIKKEGKLGYRIELADLDSVALYDDKSLDMFGTKDYIAPEITSSQVGSRIYFNNNDYVVADKRALDCYAVGLTFYNLLILERENAKEYECTDIMELSERHEARKKLLTLVGHLLNPDPKQRFTVEQALQHPCFGKDLQQRTVYFQGLIAKFEKRDMFYDSYYKATEDSYPEKDDAFLLLSAPLKEIYQIATDLDDAIKIAKDSRQMLLIDKIESKAKKLILLIDKMMQSELENPKSILLALRLGAEESLVLCSVYNIAAKDILQAANRALEKYESVNGLSSHLYSIFSLHGMSGLRRAKSLVNDLSALSVCPLPVEAMANKIRDFLIYGDGPWRLTSFKTMLKDELKKLTGVEPESWNDYLPTTKSFDQQPKK